MKIAIICSANQKSWIIGKFASQLKINLEKLGYIADILDYPNTDYDINHHVYHADYIDCKETISTFMVTHIDSKGKLIRLKQLIDLAQLGICMSKNTADFLVDKGIESKKITYIHPAHDGELSFKKIKIGVFSNIYGDGRKNENWLIELSSKISNNYFEFVFIGDGWELIVENLKSKMFEVDHKSFSSENYKNYINLVDYWLYMGFDEGSMSFLDAQQIGKKIICSNQGFHNDMKDAADYLFSNKKEFFEIMLSINKLQFQKHQYTLNNTWENFTLKHLELWNYLLKKSTDKNFKDESLDYLINHRKNNFLSVILLNASLIKHKIIKKLK